MTMKFVGPLPEKYAAAQSLLTEHLASIGQDTFSGHTPASIIQAIKEAGGTSLALLSSMTYEEISACFPVAASKPMVLVRAIAQIFREGSEERESKSPKRGAVDRMSSLDLVANYGADDPTNHIGRRLKSISEGQPFLVFSKDGMVDGVTSYKLLKELTQGYAPRERVTVDGEVYGVYRVGEKPGVLADENPLYPGRPLRPDGTCDQTGRSWEGVALPIRQLLRIAIEVGELTVNLETAHKAIDMAVGPDPGLAISLRYPKARVKFCDYEKIGKQPVLRMPLGRRSGDSNQLSKGEKVQW